MSWSSGVASGVMGQHGAGVTVSSEARKRRRDSGEKSRARLHSDAMLRESSVMVFIETGVRGRSEEDKRARPRSGRSQSGRGLRRNERKRFQEDVELDDGEEGRVVVVVVDGRGAELTRAGWSIVEGSIMCCGW